MITQNFEIIKLFLARIFQLLTEILLNYLTNPHFCREGSAERALRRNSCAVKAAAETASPNVPLRIQAFNFFNVSAPLSISVLLTGIKFLFNLFFVILHYYYPTQHCLQLLLFPETKQSSVYAIAIYYTTTDGQSRSNSTLFCVTTGGHAGLNMLKLDP